MASQVRIDVLTDASQTQRELSTTGAQVDGFGTRVDTMKSRASNAMRALAAAALLYIGTQFTKELIEGAVELDLIGNRIDTVFGEGAETIREWAGTVDERLGTSQERVAGMAASVVDVLGPALKIGSEEAFEMAQQVLLLGSDLDLFSDQTGSTQEAVDILTRAFLGEREALERLGIKVSEADIDARLLANGQSELAGDSLTAARAAAFLELATEQAGNAMEFAGGEAGENARKVRELESKWQTLKDELSVKLQPVLEFLLDTLIFLTTHIDEFGAAVAAMHAPVVWAFKEIRDMVGWVVDKVEALISAVGRIPTSLPNPFRNWSVPGSGIIRDPIGTFTDLVGGSVGGSGVVGPVGGAMAAPAAARAAPNVINLTVHALDPAAAARAVVDAIRTWERQNGPLYAAA